MVPGQEANSDNLGVLYFLHNNCMLSVLIRIASSTQHKFHDIERKFP